MSVNAISECYLSWCVEEDANRVDLVQYLLEPQLVRWQTKDNLILWGRRDKMANKI